MASVWNLEEARGCLMLGGLGFAQGQGFQGYPSGRGMGVWKNGGVVPAPEDRPEPTRMLSGPFPSS